MRNIIVVIGSVTAKEYEPLRLEYLRRGEKVEIRRVESAGLADVYACADEHADDFEESAFSKFADENGFECIDVVEVVARDSVHYENVTGFTNCADYWDRLEQVTLVMRNMEFKYLDLYEV